MKFPNTERFWKENPALYCGLLLLVGGAAHFQWSASYLVILALIFATLRCKRTLLQGVVLVAAGYIYAFSLCPPPSLSTPKIHGLAYFKTLQLTHHRSPFHHSLAYKGEVVSFVSDSKESAKRIPCHIYTPVSDAHPPADCDYLIRGTLVEKEGRIHLFKPDKGSVWQPVPDTSRFAEWRFRAKEKVRAYLKHYIPHPQARTFLTALATDEVDDRTLAIDFAKVGLQHILAISGFDFVLIGAFAGLVLRSFLSLKKTAFLVLILLSCYAFFIGNAPSVQRAWLSISLFLIGQLFNWRISALNALGAGLTLAILVNPSIICHIGFQLSFLCTLAILLLYPFSHSLCTLLLPQRPLPIAAAMPRLHQHGYVFCSLIRDALALNLAVHLVTLPVILHLFHSMPLLSLVYNLFFPFWVSLSLLLLLVSVPLTALIPPIGAALHALNSAYTGSLLELTSHPPALFNFCIRVSAFPFSLAVILIGGVFFLAILRRCTEQDLNL